MEKIIHYCWFGGKPLTKLAKKCIASWKKVLPDYEIKLWNESNCDLKECLFVSRAYENKKWAFVSDYFRCKALNLYGGLYLDTDMELKDGINDLLNNKSFLGVEDTGYVGVGIWYEPKPNGVITNNLLKKYNELNEKDLNNLENITIPILLTNYLKTLGFKKDIKEIQELESNIIIYPRDYFYPLSYNHENNIFTKNTRAIHYYDASWIDWKQKLELSLVRKFGRRKVVKMESLYFKGKKNIKLVSKKVLFPVVKYRDHKRTLNLCDSLYIERLNNTVLNIKKYKNETIAIHYSNWIGVTSSTKELFKNTVDCGELYRNKDIELVAKTIVESNIEQVIFSAFVLGWDKLIIKIKSINPNIKCKVFWHGSNSQVLDYYGWDKFMKITKLYKMGLINAFATCKESLVDFCKNIGLKTYFITNIVNTKVKPVKKDTKDIKIGLYAAKCDDWRKNMYTQIVAVSKIKNACLDMVPLNEDAINFANLLNLKIDGVKNSLNREELLKRMSKNDVNLYVTLSECAPMLPLESMSLDVPCLTGNNHHYFENNKLKEYLVIDNETNVDEIVSKIKNAIKNKEKIIEEFNLFDKQNKSNAKKQVKEFLEA